MITRETGTGKYEQLIARCKSLAPVPTAVVHPCEASALAGAAEAAAEGLISPIYVGPKARIAEIAARGGIDLGSAEIVDAPHSHAAAEQAVALVREGKAELLMKGSLHTRCCSSPTGRSTSPRRSKTRSTSARTLSIWRYRSASGSRR
jgi:phosphotransacetylase